MEKPRVLGRILKHLEEQKYRYKILRYGHHHHSEYMTSLEESHSVIFLSAHETQGLAYQEALAANIPVLAWDEGKIIAPSLQKFVQPTTNVSSVPYFDSRCGMTFKIDEFENVCETFAAQRDKFKPRQFVQETLSLEIAGHKYLEAYKDCLS